MKANTLVAVVLSLLLAGNVMAQSNSGGGSGRQSNQFTQVVQNRLASLRSWWASHYPRRPAPARPVPVVRAVPELDGNIALLALALTFSVGALIREKSRSN